MYLIAPRSLKIFTSLTSGSQWLIKETDPSSGNTGFMLMPVSSSSRQDQGLNRDHIVPPERALGVSLTPVKQGELI